MTPRIPDMTTLKHSTCALAVVTIVLLSGCRRDAETDLQVDRDKAAASLNNDSSLLQSGLADARKETERGDFDGAAQSLYGLMIRFPDNAEAKLLTAQVEAARGNLETAIELANSIEVGSKQWRAAVEFRCQVLTQLQRYTQAADLLVASLESKP